MLSKWLLVALLVFAPMIVVSKRGLGCEAEIHHLTLAVPSGLRVTQTDDCSHPICWSEYTIMTETMRKMNEMRVCAHWEYGF